MTSRLREAKCRFWWISQSLGWKNPIILANGKRIKISRGEKYWILGSMCCDRKEIECKIWRACNSWWRSQTPFECRTGWGQNLIYRFAHFQSFPLLFVISPCSALSGTWIKLSSIFYQGGYTKAPRRNKTSSKTRSVIVFGYEIGNNENVVHITVTSELYSAFGLRSSIHCYGMSLRVIYYANQRKIRRQFMQSHSNNIDSVLSLETFLVDVVILGHD